MAGDEESNVVSLDLARLAKAPHTTGPHRCLNCQHTWMCVAPLADEAGHPAFLECPQCHHFKGVATGHYLKEGPHWTCRCGNDLFHIMPTGPYCPNCGAWAKIAEWLS